MATKIRIKIRREDLPKPRIPVAPPGKDHGDKKKYNRKAEKLKVRKRIKESSGHVDGLTGMSLRCV